VADYEGHRIRKIEHTTWKVSTVAGTGDDKNSDGDDATKCGVDNPTLLVLNAQDTVLYFTAEKAVRKLDLTTGKLSSVEMSDADKWEWDPNGIAIDADGDLIVSDMQTSSIYRFPIINNSQTKVTSFGAPARLAGTGVMKEGSFLDGIGTDAQFNAPGGMAVDAVGDVFVCDSANHRIRELKLPGRACRVCTTDCAIM